MSLYVSIRLWINVQNLPSAKSTGILGVGWRRACLDSTTAEEAAGVSAAPMPPACRNEHWQADGKSAESQLNRVRVCLVMLDLDTLKHIWTRLNTFEHMSTYDVTYVWGGCLKPSSLTQLCPYGLRRQHLHWHLGATAKLEFQVNLGKKITGSWKRSPEIVHSCHNVHSIALRLALEMFIRFILTLSPTFAPWSPLGWASQTMAGRAAIAASCCARRLSWICWSRALPYDLGAAETRLSLSQKSEQKMM